jgi:phenylalanyl-tRNA synthetase alpha chain
LRVSPERLNRYLALRDLTDPDRGRHAINILVTNLTLAIERWSELPADIVRRSPVVPITDNYDRLFYEPDAIARSARHSHYVDAKHMLRTHTTAGIPALLAETESDRLIVCPGLVYRRDVVDRLHVGEPHQTDFWIVRRTRLRRADLLKMIAVVVETALPGHAYRCNETIHPYTMNGLEVEVQFGERWVEVLECGEIHPWLLNESNLPSHQWSGLAMGIGLDRLAMLIKQIDDIRLLRSSDPRIARQMLTLDRYEPVSKQPATHRDMSICVADPDMELLGDRVREVLEERGEWVENVELIQASDYASVPEMARTRLGMSPGQQNLLIRVTLRSLAGSISKGDANRVYDLVYFELHEGTAGYFRAMQAPERRKSPP